MLRISLEALLTGVTPDVATIQPQAMVARSAMQRPLPDARADDFVVAIFLSGPARRNQDAAANNFALSATCSSRARL